ncbi:hypothetical protein GCM10023148_15120 [Actinokineospora soli]
MTSYRKISASEENRDDRLLRTITAPCTPDPLADLTAQICALTYSAMVFEVLHAQVLELEVIGFVLP